MGCDTTSRLFGLRKGLAVKKIKSEDLFRKQVKVFRQAEVGNQEITPAGGGGSTWRPSMVATERKVWTCYGTSSSVERSP